MQNQARHSSTATKQQMNGLAGRAQQSLLHKGSLWQQDRNNKANEVIIRNSLSQGVVAIGRQAKVEIRQAQGRTA